MSESITEQVVTSGWTKSARRFTIWGAAIIMLGALISVVWAGFRKVEVYISLPVRLDRIEMKVNNIDTNVKILLEKAGD